MVVYQRSNRVQTTACLSFQSVQDSFILAFAPTKGLSRTKYWKGCWLELTAFYCWFHCRWTLLNTVFLLKNNQPNKNLKQVWIPLKASEGKLICGPYSSDAVLLFNFYSTQCWTNCSKSHYFCWICLKSKIIPSNPVLRSNSAQSCDFTGSPTAEVK